jgi:hypothetical protein
LLTLEEDFLAEDVVALVVVVDLAGAAVVVFLAGAAVVVVTDLDLAVVLDCAPAFMAIAIANTVTNNFRLFIIVGFRLNNIMIF